DGFATKRGRRGALVHRDEVNRRVRGRRGARMLAITSGGAIPEVADYKVLLEPDDTVVGTLNEDFAIESNAGDIFQLGNASWQIMQVASGVVRAADAKGAPPTIPFCLGEAQARSDELSRAVGELRDAATSPERQGSGTGAAIRLSRGPQHSFPLADVFRYLQPATARDILVQALLAAPVFPTRWRWNTTVSLAIPRNRGGRKVPPPLQRAMADDLMAAVFPDAAACPEHLQGDRELPDHPLVKQVVR